MKKVSDSGHIVGILLGKVDSYFCADLADIKCVVEFFGSTFYGILEIHKLSVIFT